MATERLLEFASFGGQFEVHLQNLSQIAEPEDWNYKYTSTTQVLPILYNYIIYTYKRIYEENKLSANSSGDHCCFDTGLMTSTQEPIYAFFQKNRVLHHEEWYFIKWARKGDYVLNTFPVLPEMAHYYDDPDVLVFDSRLEIRENAEHIIKENADRFPEPYSQTDPFFINNLFKGALESAKLRVKRNYKIAIPQYYKGKIQLLLPICLSNPLRADLALTVEKQDGFYRASTILSLDMAYNNARQLARPDKDWLQP